MYFPACKHINPQYRRFAQQMLCILAALRELPDDRVFCYEASLQNIFLTSPGRWNSQRFVGICMNGDGIKIAYRMESPDAPRTEKIIEMDTHSIPEAVSYFLLAIEKSGAATKCLAPEPATGPA